MAKMLEVRPKAVTGWKDEDGVDHQPTFEGTITIRRPGFDERFEILEGGASIAEAAAAGKEGSMPGIAMLQHIPALRRLVRESERYYERVALRRLSDGAEFKSFEDLSVEPECGPILIEVAIGLAHGFSSGG
jgi:hypothetical protein